MMENAIPLNGVRAVEDLLQKIDLSYIRNEHNRRYVAILMSALIDLDPENRKAATTVHAEPGNERWAVMLYNVNKPVSLDRMTALRNLKFPDPTWNPEVDVVVGSRDGAPTISISFHRKPENLVYALQEPPQRRRKHSSSSSSSPSYSSSSSASSSGSSSSRDSSPKRAPPPPPPPQQSLLGQVITFFTEDTPPTPVAAPPPPPPSKRRKEPRRSKTPSKPARRSRSTRKY
jgi:hypothetical protein